MPRIKVKRTVLSRVERVRRSLHSAALKSPARGFLQAARAAAARAARAAVRAAGTRDANVVSTGAPFWGTRGRLLAAIFIALLGGAYLGITSGAHMAGSLTTVTVLPAPPLRGANESQASSMPHNATATLLPPPSASSSSPSSASPLPLPPDPAAGAPRAFAVIGADGFVGGVLCSALMARSRGDADGRWGAAGFRAAASGGGGGDGSLTPLADTAALARARVVVYVASPLDDAAATSGAAAAAATAEAVALVEALAPTQLLVIASTWRVAAAERGSKFVSELGAFGSDLEGAVRSAAARRDAAAPALSIFRFGDFADAGGGGAAGGGAGADGGAGDSGVCLPDGVRHRLPAAATADGGLRAGANGPLASSPAAATDGTVTACGAPAPRGSLADVVCGALLEGHLRARNVFDSVSVTTAADAARALRLLAAAHAASRAPRVTTLHAVSFETTRGGWAAEVAALLRVPVLPLKDGFVWPLPEEPQPHGVFSGVDALATSATAALLCGDATVDAAGAGIREVCVNATDLWLDGKQSAVAAVAAALPSACAVMRGNSARVAVPDAAACPVCGARGATNLSIALPAGPPEARPAWVVCGCGHSFAHPPPAAAAAASPPPPAREDHAAELIALARAVAPRAAGLRVVEVGCGIQACGALPAFEAAGFIVQAPGGAGTGGGADVVVAAGALAAAADPAATLLVASAALAAGGVLVVRTPSCGLLGTGQPDAPWGGAAHAFSAASLAAAAAAAGLRVAAFAVSPLADAACLATLGPAGSASPAAESLSSALARDAADFAAGPAWPALRFSFRLAAALNWTRAQAALLRAQDTQLGCVGLAAPKARALTHALKAAGAPCDWTVECGAADADVIAAAVAGSRRVALLVADWDCAPAAARLARALAAARDEGIVVLEPFPLARALVFEGSVVRAAGGATAPPRELHANRAWPPWPPLAAWDASGGVGAWNASGRAARRPILGVTHMRDEQWLLGQWILCHAHLFDALILIDYASVDLTPAIFASLAPSSWTRQPARVAAANSDPNGFMTVTEAEVAAIEGEYVGWWRVALTAAEFLVLPSMTRLVSEWEAAHPAARVLYFRSAQTLDADDAHGVEGRAWDSATPLPYQATSFFVERWAPIAAARVGADGAPVADNDLIMPLRRGFNQYSRFMHRIDEGVGYVPGRHNLVWWSAPWSTAHWQFAPIVAPRGFILKARYGPWPEMAEYRHQQMASSGHPVALVAREREELLKTHARFDVRAALLDAGSPRFPETVLDLHRDWYELYGTFLDDSALTRDACVLQKTDVDGAQMTACGIIE